MNRFISLLSGCFIVLLAAMSAVSCSNDENVGENLNLDYTPHTIDFGSVAIGGQKTIPVTLTHIGDSGVVLIESVTTQSLNGDFVVAMPEVTQIGPGESTVVSVVYTPTDTNTDSGYLVINHNIPTLDYKTMIAVTSSGQTSALVTEPSPIDFGDVPVGDIATLDILVKNIGTAAVQIAKAYMDPEGPSSFNIIAIVPTDGDTLPVELGPEGTLGLTLQYSPTEGTPEESTLFVSGETGTVDFEVFGTGLGPKIQVNPTQLELGGVNIGETGRALCVVTNVGNDTLRVGNSYIVPGSDAGLSVEGDVDFNLAPGASRDVYVDWAVTEAQKFTGQAIGWLAFASNDASSPTVVPIYGRVNSPLLTVLPETLDMGFGAQGITVYKSVTIRNDGSADLVIAGEPQLFDISEVKYGNEWDITIKGATPVGGKYTLAAGAGMETVVAFTNKGPDSGKVTAKLRITSNDRSVEGSEKIINITISRGGTATCIPVIEPSAYNFGLVPMGFSKELPVRVVNKGMGRCSYKGTQIQDCSSAFSGLSSCSAPFTTTKSSKFLVVSQPPVVKDGVEPGAAFAIYVKFAPPQTSTLFGDISSYSALMGVMMRDSQLSKDIIVPAAGATGSYAANLQGSSGVANLAVLPSEIKFGLVTLGCASQTYQICAYNTGAAPLQVTNINLDSCTPEFRLKNVPALPRAISVGSPLCFDAQFVPQDTTADSCILKVESNDQSVPELFVGLSGQGTIYSDQTDTFTQLSGQEVDILFLIDQSGSMGDDQQNLIDSFEYFIQHADVWDNDYHIGITSVGVSDQYASAMGKLNLGNKFKSPRYITPGPNAKSQFADLANLGSDGDNSEGALQNAQAALSAPLVTDTGVSCSTDTDCKNDTNICSDSATCPFLCLESSCGGWNKGFLRSDAQLELVVLSDEEDQSSGDLGFYIDFLKSIKGFYNQNMMHFNAIVGVDDGTLTGTDGSHIPGCMGSNGVGAGVGNRYIEAANATNGKVGSICDPNYRDVLNEIGSVAFGLKQQFFLSRIADPNSITVKVRGADITEGWEYDAPSNSIIFDPESPNMPEEGDEIIVHYETLCFEP